MSLHQWLTDSRNLLSQILIYKMLLVKEIIFVAYMIECQMITLLFPEDFFLMEKKKISDDIGIAK